MEKIQKALERARQQRHQQADDDGPPRAGAATGPAPGPPAAEPLAYRETRVIERLENTAEAQRVTAALKRPEIVDTFGILRTQVLQKLGASGHRTLAITSPNRGAGKTMTSVNLAISLARRVNNTVLLVDADLRRPSVHKYFAFGSQRGLSEFLVNGTSLPSVLVNPGIERLVVLPGGSVVGRSSELLSSPKMMRLVDELRGRYPDRIVLYDLPPILVTDDALAFLEHVDSCLLVVADGQTRKGDIRRALEVLSGCNLIGSVLNKSVGKAGIAYY